MVQEVARSDVRAEGGERRVKSIFPVSCVIYVLFLCPVYKADVRVCSLFEHTFPDEYRISRNGASNILKSGQASRGPEVRP
jgi:hypothetical protein